MSEKRKRTTSIQALENIKEILVAQCMKAHFRTSNRGYEPINCSPARADLNQGKKDIISKISKEIEEYAIKKYEKYGLIIVPMCHRKSGDGEDRLEIDLKVKQFPGLEDLVSADKESEKEFRDDMKKIQTWYYNALQAVTKREDLPDVPTFEMPPDTMEGPEE